MPHASKEARREYLRGWREKNRGSIRVRANAWSRAHGDQKTAWRLENKDRVNECVREWKKRNPDKMGENRKKYREAHKAELREKAVSYFQSHPECRARYRAKGYGLTLEQHEALVAAQGGRCAICGGEERRKIRGVPFALAIDHCHDTDRVRGLLCSDCNTGIGLFRHDPDRMAAAIAYLRR